MVFGIIALIETLAILAFCIRYAVKRIREDREQREAEAYLEGFRRGKEEVTGNSIIDMVVNL